MIRVDGKPIYKKSGFKFLRSLVSVYPGYLGGTLLKYTRWLLKLDTQTTMNTFFPFFFRKVPSNHRRCLEWKLSRYIKGLYLRLSNNEFLDPVFQQHRNFIQTPYAWRKIVPWKRVILQCRIWTLRYGGGGHTDPVIRGGGGGLQIIFSTLRALLWSKNITPRAPPLDPPMFSQPSQRKRVLNEKQADPFARAKSWQQRTRML